MVHQAVFVLAFVFATFVNGNPLRFEPTKRPPVILVPGDGGSQFEAMLNKPNVTHTWCSQKTTDWYPLWLNLELLWTMDCLVDNMRLVYDPKTRTTSNSPGVQIRQPGFGNTTSVEWLDSSEIYGTTYFYYIADALVKQAGYTRNKDIRGAPYDFRKAPNENKEFMANFKKLVEEAYTTNNNQKVIIIGHSMGNPYTLTLLNSQSSSWKKKYIKSYISLSGPWGGAVKTLRLMASGDNLGMPIVNPLTARGQQRTMPSSAWLMPYDTFWNDTEILATSPIGNYTVKDYKRFFQDINFMTGYEMRQDTEPLALKKLEAPGVEVHCLHGSGVETPAKFFWSKSSWYDNQPTVTYGDGDGTVNMRSLLGCLQWKKSGYPVYHQTYPDVDHMKILESTDAINYILKVVKS